MNKWAAEVPFDFVGGAHETSTWSFDALDAEDLVMSLVGTIEGPVVLLEKPVDWQVGGRSDFESLAFVLLKELALVVLEELDPAGNWQDGGRSDFGSLALINNDLGLFCCADEAGTEGFEDISADFSVGEAKV